mmetsp:Transcript_763/g.1313  ORF Transcript_763/g.1313 Transcript_763/m.1313 type:complete len:150 (-) Transcript_763:211-660(-)
MVWQFCVTHRSLIVSSGLDSLEWFSYSYVGPQIEKAVFHGNYTLTWAVWSLPWYTAIVGASCFGYIADQYGRKESVYLSGACLITGTVAQALTPTHRIAGPIWMVLARVALGFGYGGKYSVGCVYLSESAPRPMMAMSRQSRTPSVSAS